MNLEENSTTPTTNPSPVNQGGVYDQRGQTVNGDQINVGRDVIASIVNTGDHNHFFIDDYERLRDAYIDPGLVFARVLLL